MFKNNGLVAVIGFVLVATGILSLVLNMIGARFTFLRWLDQLGPLFGFLVRIGFVLAGFILMYLALTQWKETDKPT